MKDLFVHLQDEFADTDVEVTFPTYMPGEHESPYIVIDYRNSDIHFTFHSTLQDSYGVQVFVPKKQYSRLEPLVHRVRRSMRELYPMFIEEQVSRTAAFYDDMSQTHYVELCYYNAKYRDY